MEGKGPQRSPRKRLGRRLEEVAQAVGGGYCRLQMPLRLALGVTGTVAGHRLGALEGGGLAQGLGMRGGGGTSPLFQCIPWAGGSHTTHPTPLPPLPSKNGPHFLPGLRPKPKFSSAPAAPIRLDQTFSSVPSAPLKTQHRWAAGGPRARGVGERGFFDRAPTKWRPQDQSGLRNGAEKMIYKKNSPQYYLPPNDQRVMPSICWGAPDPPPPLLGPVGGSCHGRGSEKRRPPPPPTLRSNS